MSSPTNRRSCTVCHRGRDADVERRVRLDGYARGVRGNQEQRQALAARGADDEGVGGGSVQHRGLAPVEPKTALDGFRPGVRMGRLVQGGLVTRQGQDAAAGGDLGQQFCALLLRCGRFPSSNCNR